MNRRPTRWLVIALVVGAGIGIGFAFITATGRDTSTGLGTFELGEGREVRVWRESHFGDPSTLWFEVAHGDKLLQPPRHLGTAGRGWYDVKTVWTADRTVSCTFSARDPFTFAVYCDWTTDEVWPSGDDAKLAKWRAVYQKLRAANPEMPRDKAFEAAVGNRGIVNDLPGG